MKLFRLHNTTRTAFWGDNPFIAEALGLPPGPADGPPLAEARWGAHPQFPSFVELESGSCPLNELIAEESKDGMEEDLFGRDDGALPFMLKLLGVKTPHSLHAHPPTARAIHGYARENAAGIPFKAPDRVYMDPNDRPEMIVALGRLESLCGFRPPAELKETISLTRTDSDDPLERFVKLLGKNPGRVELAIFSHAALTLTPAEKNEISTGTLAHLRALSDEGRIPKAYRKPIDWVFKLGELFPGDIGILAPVLFNYVDLSDGEALFIPPGEPHTHLRGSAIEASTNSDTILRIAMTNRMIDPTEIMTVLNFNEDNPAVLQPEIERLDRSTRASYPVLTPYFQLERYVFDDGLARIPIAGPEILLCLGDDSRIVIKDHLDGSSLALGKGQAAFVLPDSVEADPECFLDPDTAAYDATGRGTLWRVSLPRFP